MKETFCTGPPSSHAALALMVRSVTSRSETTEPPLILSAVTTLPVPVSWYPQTLRTVQANGARHATTVTVVVGVKTVTSFENGCRLPEPIEPPPPKPCAGGKRVN